MHFAKRLDAFCKKTFCEASVGSVQSRGSWTIWRGASVKNARRGRLVGTDIFWPTTAM